MQRESIMIKTLFNTLDQNITIDIDYICRRFELIVFKVVTLNFIKLKIIYFILHLRLKKSCTRLIIVEDSKGVISWPIPPIIFISESLIKDEISLPSSGKTNTSSSPCITKQGKLVAFNASLRSPNE